MSSEPLFPGTRELIAPEYTYLIEDLKTGSIVAEYNFTGVTYNNMVNGIGKFSGKTALTRETMKQDPRNTLVAGMNGIWVMRNNYPVWCGIIVDCDMDQNKNIVSIKAVTYEYWFSRRIQIKDINVKSTDQLDIARMYVNSGDAAKVMRIEVDSTTTSPIKRERNAYAYELNTIEDELSRLSKLIDGFEYRIIPYKDVSTGKLYRKLTFGYPTLTTNTEKNTSFVFESNRNLTNITVSTSIDDSALRVYGIGEGEGESQKVAIADDTELLAAGYPRYESSLSAKSVKEYSTLVSHVTNALTDMRAPITEIKVTARGSDDPYVGSYHPGDWIRLKVDNLWFPTGLDEVFRVTNIDVKLTDRGQETVDLTFKGHGVRDKLVAAQSSMDVYVPPDDTKTPGG